MYEYHSLGAELPTSLFLGSSLHAREADRTNGSVASCWRSGSQADLGTMVHCDLGKDRVLTFNTPHMQSKVIALYTKPAFASRVLGLKGVTTTTRLDLNHKRETNQDKT